MVYTLKCASKLQLHIHSSRWNMQKTIGMTTVTDETFQNSHYCFKCVSDLIRY
jgi:hypothetical protein